MSRLRAQLRRLRAFSQRVAAAQVALFFSLVYYLPLAPVALVHLARLRRRAQESPHSHWQHWAKASGDINKLRRRM